MRSASLQRLSDASQRASGHPEEVDMSLVDCLALCGGQGSRLFPLTQARSKPGVAFGGYYRLVDIALSNALSARCRKIYVLTQCFASSLHQHIYKAYSTNPTVAHTIEILTAEQRMDQQCWYRGTADAVRQNIATLKESPARYFLIICGDQVYHLDFARMVRVAQKRDADLLIASVLVNETDASRFGVMKVNERHAIKDFCEKPREPRILKRFVCPQRIVDAIKPGSEGPFYIGSMGIYLFKREALFQLLEDDLREDFGKHLIPTQLDKGSCHSYIYDGYWEDIGTIASFYHTNLALTRQEPPFSWYTDNPVLRSLRQSLPPAKILQANVNHSLICDGAIVEADQVTNSILGPRTIVNHGSVIQDSYVIGNDTYCNSDGQPLAIGRGCHLRRVILDHNVSLGAGVVLTNQNQLHEYNGDGVFIRDGIIIVTRGTHLPDGFTL
jgi:glucose-1-phosphate adenylyltransferase